MEFERVRETRGWRPGALSRAKRSESDHERAFRVDGMERSFVAAPRSLLPPLAASNPLPSWPLMPFMVEIPAARRPAAALRTVRELPSSNAPCASACVMSVPLT
jgi:hypothetical protein